MAHRENVDLEPYLSTCVTFCFKCPTDEISTNGRQVICLPNVKNPLVGNVSNSSYGGSNMAKFRRFSAIAKIFLSPNRAYNGSKNCFRGTCPKTFVDGRNAFWRGQKNFPHEILTPQKFRPQNRMGGQIGNRGST